MNYTKITYPDLNNGDGCRVTLWLSGCHHRCPGCHNQWMQDPNVGKLFTPETYKKLTEILSLPYIQGITLSGGDPLYNVIEIKSLLRDLKNDFPNKDIWLYTGDKYESIDKEILNLVDVVVDGEYKEELRDITLPFRGSSNQRINYVK